MMNTQSNQEDASAIHSHLLFASISSIVVSQKYPLPASIRLIRNG